MSTMPPISFSRSAFAMSCTSPAARNCAIHARRSWRSLVGEFLVGRGSTAVSMQPLYRSMDCRGRGGVQTRPAMRRVLHVQDQPLGLAAAAADHDLLIGGLLFLAQH